VIPFDRRAYAWSSTVRTSRTEVASTPSLAQLDEAVRAFIDGQPNAEVIVSPTRVSNIRVGDHERARFKAPNWRARSSPHPRSDRSRDAFILRTPIDQGRRVEQRFLPGVSRRIPVALRRGTPHRRQTGEGRRWVFTNDCRLRTRRSSRPVKKLSGDVVRRRENHRVGTTLTPGQSTR